MPTTTPNISLVKPDIGMHDWGTIANANLDILDSRIGSLAGAAGINASLGGNTSGTLGLISTGTILLAGGSNITLSQNGNSVTISGANPGSQSVQTQNLFDLTLGGNTSGTLALVSSGTLLLAGGSNVTLSQNGNSVTIIGGAGGGGGGIAESLGGNTAGVLALISTGTMLIAGGNNVTLSQNGNSVTISGPNTVAQSVQSQNLFDLSLGGNTVGALALISSGTALIAGGNNVTLSQNGQSITISGPNTAAQSNQTDGIYASSQTVGQSSSFTHDARSLTLVGQGIVSVGWSNSSLLISATTAQSVQTQNLIDLSLAGNTAGALALVSSGTAILAGGNNITLSQNGQSVTISGPNTAAQTNQSLGIYGSSQTVGQSSSSTYDARSLSLVGQGAVSVGWSNSSLLISAPNTIAQTAQSIGVYASSQTVGQSSSSTIDARSFTHVGQGAVSVGMSGGSLLISAPNTIAQTNQSLGIYGSSQTVGQSSSSTYDARSLSIAGQGIVSVGWSNSSFLISATTPAQSNQTLGIYASSQTLGQSSSSTYDARSLSVVGQGVVSVGWSNSSLLISAPAAAGDGVNIVSMLTSTSGGGTAGATFSNSTGSIGLMAGSNITLSQTSNTIVIQGQPEGTQSFAMVNMFGTIAKSDYQNGNIFPFSQAGFLSFSQVNAFVSLNISTSATANSTNAGTISAGLSIYTRTGSTLSLASSGSQSFGWTFTSNVSNASLTSIKAFTIPLNANMTPGDYWVAFTTSTSSASQLGFTASFIFGSSPGWSPMAGTLGGSSPGSAQIMPGWGNVTVTQSTQSLGFNLIQGSASANRVNPSLVFLNFSS
jgi:hypothetical protein